MNQPTTAEPDDPAQRGHWWRRPRWEIVAVAVAAIGVIVAVLAWRFPIAPASDDQQAGSQPTAGRTATSGRPANPPSGPQGQSVQRALADLPVKSGRGNIEVADDPAGGAPMVTIRCASGVSIDRFREVEFELNGFYRELDADVQATVPEPERSTQLEVFGDNTLIQNVVLAGTETKPLRATVTAANLRLRLTCQRSEGALVLHNARVRG